MSLQKNNIRIYDIARKATVSTATLSKVFTGKSNVNEDTKSRIEKIIKDLKYEPNLIARALHDKKTKTIAIFVQSLTNPFFVTKLIFVVLNMVIRYLLELQIIIIKQK